MNDTEQTDKPLLEFLRRYVRQAPEFACGDPQNPRKTPKASVELFLETFLKRTHDGHYTFVTG